MRILSSGLALALCLMAAAAKSQDEKFMVREKTDEISGKKTKSISLIADDGKSVLQLGVSEGGLVSVGIAPKDTIFPDKTDAAARRMEVSVTLRSTAMDKPITKIWRMGYLKYDAAIGMFSRKEAEDIFSGEAVTIRLDGTGDRYRFVTAGEGFEAFRKNIDQLLENVPDQARPTLASAEDGTPRPSGNAKDDRPQDNSETAELMEARQKGEEAGRNMMARSAGTVRRESDIRGRALATADRIGWKKASDPRRKAFVEGYMSQFPEFKRGK